MINAIVAFKKAVAEIGFKKAVATTTIKLGDFLIFRVFFETLGIVDTPAKSVGKPLADNSGTADAAKLGFGTAQSDSGATSDQIDTFAIGKLILDTPSVGESIFIRTTFSRAYTDVFYAGESISVGSGKVFADSSGATDEESLQFIKALADASGATDETLLSPNKVASDSSGTTDNQNMDFHKFIDEVTGVTDDQEMTFTKVRSDLATIVDAFSYSSSSAVSDTLGASDSGSIRGQGYCSFDYFAEDYVGYSKNF